MIEYRLFYKGEFKGLGSRKDKVFKQFQEILEKERQDYRDDFYENSLIGLFYSDGDIIRKSEIKFDNSFKLSEFVIQNILDDLNSGSSLKELNLDKIKIEDFPDINERMESFATSYLSSIFGYFFKNQVKEKLKEIKDGFNNPIRFSNDGRQIFNVLTGEIIWEIVEVDLKINRQQSIPNEPIILQSEPIILISGNQ